MEEAREEAKRGGRKRDGQQAEKTVTASWEESWGGVEQGGPRIWAKAEGGRRHLCAGMLRDFLKHPMTFQPP